MKKVIFILSLWVLSLGFNVKQPDCPLSAKEKLEVYKQFASDYEARFREHLKTYGYSPCQFGLK